MARYLSSILPFAAAVAAASMLSTAPPASAAGIQFGARSRKQQREDRGAPASGTGRRNVSGSPHRAIIGAIDTPPRTSGAVIALAPGAAGNSS